MDDKKPERLSEFQIRAWYKQGLQKWLANSNKEERALARTLLQVSAHPDEETRYYLTYDDLHGGASALYYTFIGASADYGLGKMPKKDPRLPSLTRAMRIVAKQPINEIAIHQIYNAAHYASYASSRNVILPHPIADQFMAAFAAAATRLPSQAYTHEDSRLPYRWCGLFRGEYVAEVALTLVRRFQSAQFSARTHQKWFTCQTNANPLIQYDAFKIRDLNFKEGKAPLSAVS